MTVARLNTLTESLTTTTEQHRHRLASVAADRDLTDAARAERQSEIHASLLRELDQARAEGDPIIRDLTGEAESRMRTLALATGPVQASHRVTLALENSHPSDLVEVYETDQDIDALLALRHLAPSVGGKYADTPGNAAALTQGLRARIDDALSRVAPGTSDLNTATRRQAQIRQAEELYRAAAFYATSPNAHGLLASALADAMTGASA